MSTTIDQKVVEMRFDNKQFEANVSNTMSTLDKLKQKLHLSGASKGLEEINAATKRVDMSGLGRSVETVSAKFSALQVMGVTALANITNQAVNAGKRLVAAFTVDPVKTGFQEYELKMGSVQTIMASTGESLKTVNNYLEELNKYSDKTIYSFSDMTNNIGKFTNAGVKLEDAVLAIKGISNEAAVSGANANEASRAMYNFSQALSAGYVKLIDWKSIENANMATVEFKDQLIASAVACGTLKDNLDGTYTTLEKGTIVSATRNFNDSLQEQWMTTEVLTQTLANYATDVREMTDVEREAYEEKLRGQGYTEEQIKKIEELGKKAYDSAQDVKTFSMMMDTLKEAAQSGWAKTWELILGDFEQAKSLWTSLSKFFGNLIDKMSDARNDLIESALGKAFTALAEKVKTAVYPIQKSADSIKAVAESVKNYASVVDEIIGGKWGNGQARWDKLTEAGYDWAHAQNLVNEKLGNAKRHATEYAEAQGKVAENQEKVKDSQDKTTDSTVELTKAEKGRLKIITKLSEEDLRALKYTDEQITAINELKETAEKLGIPLDEFIDNLDQINGRWLLLNSFKNAGKGLVSVITAIGDAWRKAFHGDATDEEIMQKKADAIFNMIAALHKFSTKLVASDKTIENITKTFKGLFAVLDIISTITGGGIKIAFKVLSKVLRAFNVDILEFTGNIGDMLVQFRDWLFENNKIAKAIDGLIDKIPAGIKAIKNWIEEFKKIPEVQKFLENLKTKFDDFKTIGTNIIEGLSEGIEEGITSLPGKMVELGEKLLQALKDILGIHSPSTETHEIGVNFVEGFIEGVKEFATKAYEEVQKFGKKVLDYAKEIEWDKILALGISVSMVWFVKKVGDALSGIASAFEGFGDILENVAKVTKSFSKVLNEISWDFKAKAIQKLAISLAIMVGAILLLVKVGGDDYAKLWNAVGIIGVLALILVGLAAAMGALSSTSLQFEKGKLNIDGIKSSLLTIGLAILALGVTVKLLGSMNIDQYTQGMLGVVGMAGVLMLVLAAYGQLVKGKSAQNIDKAGKMIFKMSISLLLMAGVCKIVGQLSAGELLKGAAFAAGFTLFVLALTGISKISGKGVDKLGGMLLKISFAMGLMVGVIKLISTLSAVEMLQGAAFATGFVIFVGLLGLATRAAGKEVPKLGGLLLSISFSMMLMVGVCKLINKLSPEEMVKGAAFAAGFLVFVKLLTSVLKIGNEQKMAQLTDTILAMSVSIAILAGVSILLGLIDTKDLAKGVTAVTVLGLVMAAMIKATTKARKVKGELIVLTVAVAVMAAAVAGLSMIDAKDLAGATLAMSALMGVFSIVVRSAKDIKESWPALIVMTVAIGVMAGAIWLLSTLKVEDSIKNATALSILMLAMAGVMRIITGVTTDVKKALAGVVTLASLCVPMWLFVQVLKQMNGLENVVTNVITLSGLMLAMTGVVAILSLIGLKGFAALAGVVTLASLCVPMWLFVQVLKQMNGLENAKTNAIVLGGLMLAMTGVVTVLSLVGLLALAAIAGVIAMCSLAIPMNLFVSVLGKMNDIQNATENADLLINLMKSMTGVLTQLAIIGPFALIGVAAMQGLVLLIGEIGLMAVAVGALVEKFPSIQNFLDTGIPVLEQLAEGLGTMIGKFIGGIGEGIGDSLVQIGDDITEFMESLKEASATAEGIKGSSFDGVKQLIESLIGVGATAVGMSIADYFTQQYGDKSAIEKFKDDGVAFFEAFKEIATAANGFTFPEGFSAKELKTLIEAILAVGVVSAGTSLVDKFTEAIGGESAMEKFKEDGKAFFKAVKEISSEMTGFSFPEDFSIEGLNTLLDVLKSVGKSMSSLSISEIFTQLFCDETTMYKFKEDGKAFFKAIKEISSEMTGFSFPEDFSIEGLNTLLDALKSVGNSMMGLSIADIFASGDVTAMDKFQTDGVAFFKAIKAISAEAIGYTFPEDFSIEGLTKLFDTLKSVSDYTKGASWDDLFTLGGTTIEKFQKDGVGFFTALTTMSTEASGINNTAFTTAETAISKIKSVIASVDGIDYSGVKEFTGIGTGGFGADGPMHDIAVALTDFGDTVSEINLSAMTTSITAATKLKVLISSLVGLDTSGISNFKPKDIGKEMKNYSKQVEDIDPSLVSSSISSARSLASLIRSLVGIDTSGISSFNVKSIGDKMKVYSDSVSKINSGAISSSISAANRLRSLINSLAGLDTSGVGPFKNAIETLGTVQVNKIVSSFSSASGKLANVGANLINSIVKGVNSRKPMLTETFNSVMTFMNNVLRKNASQFNHSGIELMSKLSIGMMSKRSLVLKSATTTFTTVITSIRGYYTSFYSAGSYLVDGFADGISVNSYKAAAKARAMALAAKKAAEEALGIASPSKVFHKIGEYTGQGFVNALTDYRTASYNASYDIAEYARKGLSKAVAKIQDTIVNDDDYQPTIRPVLDLTDVETGANAISRLFSKNQSVGVSTNINSVSAMMNRRNQNGGTGDIVDAINRLRKDIGNISNTTYSIDGISYDDGSNISNAVESLVRAARMERRI